VIRSHEERENSNVEIYSETFRRGVGQEMDLGEPMMQTVSNALKIFNVHPMSCVVWRDGVGDTAINTVARQEIPAVRRALASLSLTDANATASSAPASLAYVVVQKRIATKFFTTDGRNALPCGSLITSLQGSQHSTFYINGTAPPFSTPKPARFIIASMDEGLGSEDKVISDLSWALCHDYANWTGPIKLPSPVQMAHKLAELAGGFIDCGESIHATKYANKIYFL